LRNSNSEMHRDQAKSRVEAQIRTEQQTAAGLERELLLSSYNERVSSNAKVAELADAPDLGFYVGVMHFSCQVCMH